MNPIRTPSDSPSAFANQSTPTFRTLNIMRTKSTFFPGTSWHCSLSGLRSFRGSESRLQPAEHLRFQSAQKLGKVFQNAERSRLKPGLHTPETSLSIRQQCGGMWEIRQPVDHMRWGSCLLL